MSAPQFTSGPWEYTATVAMHDRPDLPCVVDEHRLVVAQCWDDGHTEDECEANARLIAAAPDLYEALRTARGQVVALMLECGHSPEVAVANVSGADAALAKARGESGQ